MMLQWGAPCPKRTVGGKLKPRGYGSGGCGGGCCVGGGGGGSGGGSPSHRSGHAARDCCTWCGTSVKSMAFEALLIKAHLDCRRQLARPSCPLPLFGRSPPPPLLLLSVVLAVRALKPPQRHPSLIDTAADADIAAVVVAAERHRRRGPQTLATRGTVSTAARDAAPPRTRHSPAHADAPCIPPPRPAPPPTSTL